MNTSDGGEPEVALRLASITKRFGSLTANDAISLTLQRGEIIGLLGENGAGKTTLMNILFGHYVADEGTIHVNGKPLLPGSPGAALAAGVGMVHQHFTLADNLTVLDNIILGTESLARFSSARSAARKRIQELGLAFGLGINPDALVSTLSVGERQRVEILKALYRKARILILDEPTAVLTPQESSSLFETLKRFAADGLSIILISHKLGEVMAACGRIAVLRGGKLVAERSTANVSRAELGELMVGRTVPQVSREAGARGPAVLQLDDISAKSGGQRLSQLNLTLHQGEVLGIAGVAGNGQNLLAALVSGLVVPERGSISLLGQTLHSFSPTIMVKRGVARIPEDRHAEGLVGDMSVTENMISESYKSRRFQRGGFINWQAARAFAANVIATYDVKCPSPDARVRLLSGGNMQKLILGRVMAGKPSIILANQPTRGLDVGAVAEVHGRLQAAKRDGAGILLISEDLDELLALSDRVSVMYRGEISEPMERGDISVAGLGLRMAGQGFSHAA